MKRFFDLVISLFGIVCLIPVFIIISSIVYFFIGRPVIFIQRRPGYNGKPFNMYKFRSLTNEMDSNGTLLSDDARLTKFGRLLRSSSLDELPEIFNVLKGDMSFVGPRPLRMYYMPLYNDFQIQRHNVKPGITGWAQVNGRNSLTWEQKFDLDVWYVNNHSLLLDIKIIFLTIKKVIKREDVTPSDTHFTTPFCGTGNKMLPFDQVIELKRKLG